MGFFDGFRAVAAVRFAVVNATWLRVPILCALKWLHLLELVARTSTSPRSSCDVRFAMNGIQA